MGLENEQFFNLNRDKVQWRVFVNTVMNLVQVA